MKLGHIKQRDRNQQGIAIVEFSIVASVLMLLLFGIMEIGRLMFSMQMLNEITRKAARLATVCFIVDDSKLNTSDFGSTFNSPIDLSSLVLDIKYLDDSGSVVANPTSEAGFTSIRYAQASISDFSYSFAVFEGILGGLANIDAFQTTLPAESLGVYRPYMSDAGSYVTSPANMDCQS